MLRPGEGSAGDALRVTLEDGDAVYGLPEVPQSEGGVLAAGHHQPAGPGVTGGPGQLHVVARQCLQHRGGGNVPERRRPVPAGGDCLVPPGQPVSTDDDPLVAAEDDQGRPLPRPAHLNRPRPVIRAVAALGVAVRLAQVGRTRTLEGNNTCDLKTILEEDLLYLPRHGQCRLHCL